MFRRRQTYHVGYLILVFLLIGCSQEPKPIHLHSDECAHCKMMITDARFAAQIVNEKGKAIKFDAIECLADYYEANKGELTDAKLWVSDFNDPGQWIEAGKAVIVKSQEIQSPMGRSLLALKNKQEAKEHLDTYPGKIIAWNEITNP